MMSPANDDAKSLP